MQLINGMIPDGNTETEMDTTQHKKVHVAPESDGDKTGEILDAEQGTYEQGIQKFNRLGWKRLTILLFVEAIALGSLSMPAAFATLGMVAGVICCVGIGFIAMYTSYIVGQVKVAYPDVAHYADAGRLIMGCFGYELVNLMLILQLLFLVGSHCLTGTIALANITGSDICSIIFAVVSMVILIMLAIPPSFAEIAILGYIDFISIIAAIGITIIGTGVQATQSPGLSQVEWSAWPNSDATFGDAFIAIANLSFAYSFAMCQFSFMDEMHTPKDYIKSVLVLGNLEIIIYTVTGATIYAFVGQDVKSPALLSAGNVLSRVTFGVALPVIFISGSICTTVLGRLIHGRVFRNSNIRFVNTKMGWITWVSLVTFITVLAFVIAEVIPFFNDLISISSSLFITGFAFYFPAIMWFKLLREGSWTSMKNLAMALVNGCVFLIGITVLVLGTYGSVHDIVSIELCRLQHQPDCFCGQLLTLTLYRSKNIKRARWTASFRVVLRLELGCCTRGPVVCKCLKRHAK